MKLSLKPAVAALVLASPSLAFAAEYVIDSAHSAANFTVKHMMVSNVRGSFSKVTGTVNLDEKDLTKSTVEAVIDATTVNTNEPKRDEHLKSADFLDVAKFPTITFQSTGVEVIDDDAAKVTGDLTIKGVTKPVVLDVELNKLAPSPMTQAPTAGFTATTVIKRSDFGVSAYVPAVGDELTVRIDAESSPAG